jgi:hypothetical protein
MDKQVSATILLFFFACFGVVSIIKIGSAFSETVFWSIAYGWCASNVGFLVSKYFGDELKDGKQA